MRFAANAAYISGIGPRSHPLLLLRVPWPRMDPAALSAVAPGMAAASTGGAGGAAGYWQSMCRRFSPGAMCLLTVLNCCGSVSFSAVGLVLPYYLKRDMGLGPSEAQYWGSMIGATWALKPLMGIVTETFPVRGLRFKPYFVLSGVLTVAGLAVLGLFPPNETSAFTGLMLFAIGSAWSDLLANAYTVIVARRDSSAHAAADLNSFGSGVYGLAGVVGALTGGALYWRFRDARLCYCILAAQQSLQIAAACRSEWVVEPVVKKEVRCDTVPVKKTWDALRPSGPSEGVLIGLLTFFALSVAVVPDTSQALFAFYTDDDTTVAFAVTISNFSLPAAHGDVQVDAGTDIGCTWVHAHQHDEAADICLLPDHGGSESRIFVHALEADERVQLPQVLVYYCPTTCAQCDVTHRGCLRFGTGFITFISVLSSFSGFVASVLYSQYLAGLPMRTQIFWLMVFSPLTGFCDVILINRWNVAAGINDHWFAGVDTVMQELVNSLLLLAVYTLVTDICPESIEATLFSWVMGVIFLAGAASSIFGGVLAEELGVTNEDYSPLGLLCMVRVALCASTVMLVPLVPTEAAIDAMKRRYTILHHTAT